MIFIIFVGVGWGAGLRYRVAWLEKAVCRTSWQEAGELTQEPERKAVMAARQWGPGLGITWPRPRLGSILVACGPARELCWPAGCRMVWIC